MGPNVTLFAAWKARNGGFEEPLEKVRSKHSGLQRSLTFIQIVIAIFGMLAAVSYNQGPNLYAFFICLIICASACVFYWELSQSARRNADIKKYDTLLYDTRQLRYAIREFGVLSAIDAPSDSSSHEVWLSEWLTATFIRVLDGTIADAYRLDPDRYSGDDVYNGEPLKELVNLDDRYYSLNLALKKFGLQLADQEEYRLREV